MKRKSLVIFLIVSVCISAVMVVTSPFFIASGNWIFWIALGLGAVSLALSAAGLVYALRNLSNDK
ncbi:MAG: hypothetical protein LUD27_08495 [Clostridia bacterium]|nr:hypothetical protein [Clostridia bacterium]